MTAYLDASVLVSMFVADANTERAWRWAEDHGAAICSLWTVAEFSSALGGQVRVRRLEPSERQRAEAQLDQWLGRDREPVAPSAEDLVVARRMLRETASSLRTSDALHLAICQRLGAKLVSFDKQMLQVAAELGIATADI